MSGPESTCWTVIQAAAAGDADGREEFVRRYTPVVRAYLAARWRASAHLNDLDDAVQDVFVECFKPGGMLAHADRDWPAGFRAFLHGAVRNVALRVERKRARLREQPPGEDDLDQVAAEDPSLSRLFDQAWARAILREAARRQAERARQSGEAARRRVELLHLRFHEGLPIRDIARRWDADAALLHHEYARARQEFKAALHEVMAFHHPGSAADIERECANLLSFLG